MLAPALLVPFWPVSAAGPSLTISGRAVPSATLDVLGSGFNAQSWVGLSWDGSRAGMPVARTTTHGKFDTSFVIPAWAAFGSHTLRVHALASWYRTGTDGTTIVATTVVVERPSPTAAPTAVPSGGPGSSGPVSGSASAAPGGGATPTGATPTGSTPSGAPTPGSTGSTPATGPTNAPPSAPAATVKPTAPPTAHPTPTVKPTTRPTTPPTTPTSEPTTPPTPTGEIYGSAMAIDTKDNLPVGGEGLGKVAHRFRASTSSALTAIRWAQRGGAGGYSGGNGGTIRISVQADVNGQPSGQPLASLDYVINWPGNTWAPFNQQTFPSPATLTAGKLYDIVFENVDPNPASNFISVNEVYVYNYTYSPRQVAFSNDYAVLYSQNGGSFATRARDTADMDLTYANGRHDGQAYIEAMAAKAAYISGSAKMARERFTVSGSNKVVAQATVRVMRLAGSGSNPLTVTLETGSGTEIESVNIATSSVPVSTVGDTSAGTWVTARFTTPHVLTKGQTYNLRLSTGSGVTYVAIPIREGTDSGFRSYRFTDGDGQMTTNGSSWANCYPYSPVDLQFYLK